jgi:hypothetical protein
MTRHASLTPLSAPLLRGRSLLAAAVLPLVFTACAPNTSKTSPAGESFVNRVQRECSNKRFGGLSVSDLMNSVSPRYSAYLVDITARYGQGTLSWDDYVRGVMTVNGGGGPESTALTCIKAQKS